MSDQWRCHSFDHALECYVTFRKGEFILYNKIPVSTIELPKRRFQTLNEISLPEKII